MALPFILEENNDLVTNITLAINQLNNIELPKMKMTYQSSDDDYNYYLMEIAEKDEFFQGSFLVKIPLPGKPGNINVTLRPNFYKQQYENWYASHKMNDRIIYEEYRSGMYEGRKITGITLPIDYDNDNQTDFAVRLVGNKNLYNHYSHTATPAISEHGERHINFRYLGKKYIDGFFYSKKYNENGKQYGFLIAEDPDFENQIIDFFKKYTDDNWYSDNPDSWDLEGAILRSGSIHLDTVGSRTNVALFDLISIELPKKGNRPFGSLDIPTNKGIFYPDNHLLEKWHRMEEIHIDQTTGKGNYSNGKISYYDINAAFGYTANLNIPYNSYVANRLAGYMLNKLPEIAHIDGYTVDCCPSSSSIMHWENQYCCIMDYELDKPTRAESMEHIYQRLVVIGGFNLNLFFREEPLYISCETKPTIETIIEDIFKSTNILLPSAKLGMSIDYISKEESGKPYDEYILTAKEKFASIYFEKNTYCTIRWSPN